MLMGCSAARTAQDAPQPVVAGWNHNSVPIGSAQPMGRIYKVDSQWADHVTATVADGNLISYPAPGDIVPVTAPVALADGWYLDRQGVNVNTVFLKWTRQEYAALKSVPSPSEIKAGIVSGARISELYELPVTAGVAANDTAAVNRLIESGLKDCKSLLPVFRLNK